MIAKLLSMVARVDRLTSIGVATAGEPVLLTDAQLDMAVGGNALVATSVTNASALTSWVVNDGPDSKLASVTANFMTLGPASLPHSGTVSAQVLPTM